MSYSFSARGATRAQALEDVSQKMAEVVKQQPVHEADQSSTIGAAAAFLEVLAEDSTQDYTVSLSGSLWKTEAGVQQASVSVNVQLVKKETP